jgi:WD40 repeat protein
MHYSISECRPRGATADAHKRVCSLLLLHHSQAVNSVAFHPSGNYLLTSSDDSTLKVCLITDTALHCAALRAVTSIHSDHFSLFTVSHQTHFCSLHSPHRPRFLHCLQSLRRMHCICLHALRIAVVTATNRNF